MKREEILDLSPKLPPRPAWQELSTPTTVQLTPNFQQKNRKKQKKKIDFKDLSFSEEESAIKKGGLSCPLPPYKNEFYLCRVMFNQKAGIPIGWDVVYKETTGEDNFESKSRSVYDTVDRINKRLMKAFNIKDKLFTWQNKTIKRNF